MTPLRRKNVLKFAGELLDPTGLYYLRARLYDPSSGRFTRRDPASPDPGEPYISSYAYAANRPTSMIDPSGMTFIPSNEGQDAAQKPASPGSTERQLQLHRPGDRNTVVCPIPAGYPKKIAPPGVHATDGLKGYPAMDFMAPAGTPVLAVVDGKIRRWSGSDPANGPVGNIHGPFGFSIYLAGSSGSDFYYTHLGTRRRSPGQPVRAGDIVGTIGNYARWGGANHAHIGVHGGPITIGMVYRSPQVGGR